MSGGVAYVLDEAGDFARRCNLAMVDLQPVPAEEKSLEKLHHATGDLHNHGLVDITSQMDRKDAERVWELLSRHHKYTGSSRARTILDNWAEFLPKFVKVMPVEYARALKELEEAQKTSDGMTIGVKRSA
jgi:glutamate synthase (NADPH/NADH) large chain